MNINSYLYHVFQIIDDTTGEAAIVDPVEPETVLQAVQDEKANLTTVLTTHHHWDHAGGNKKLLSLMPNLIVYGGDDRIDELKHKVSQGNDFKVGSLKISCLATPCHTTGHICYYVTDADGGSKAVFTGDTLFMGGCGRFFEGNGQQMNEALNVKLAQLSDETVRKFAISRQALLVALMIESLQLS
jgi:hydroxyacylglutathione hydrolase